MPLPLFFRVTLPAAWRGVLASLVLAFARAIGEFGATIMVAGNIPGRTNTMPLEIFVAYQGGDDGYVPQQSSLFPFLSVAENVAFGLPRSERKKSPAVVALLEELGVARLERRAIRGSVAVPQTGRNTNSSTNAALTT